MAESQVNYEDDFTVEDETALSRLEERDRADSQGAGISPYAAMAFGANMLPSAGISDVLGYGPDMNVVGGTMPSFSENIESGNYLDAGLQTLGASGDVMLAASPFFPALIVPAAVVKGISSAGKVIKGASKANKVPDDLNLGSGSLFNPEVKKGRKLLIVSCSADKCPDPGDMEAFDRYTGDMYKSIKKVGVPEENVDLAIMSAKYGLIRRDTPIPDYDVKMDKEIAGNLLKDPAQVDRIKNTIAGYDEVVVEGSDLYKGVVKEAAGDIPLRDFKVDFKKAVELGEVKPDGGYGSGRQKQSVGNFLRSNTPVDVYHFSQNTDPGFTQFDLNKVPFFEMGPHVGSTPKAAEDRFMDLTYGFGGRQTAKDMAKKSGIDYNTALSQMTLPPVSGNVGYGKQFNQPIPRKTLGGSIPLKANLSKPFLNPKTDKPFTESGLNAYQAEQYSIFKGENFTADDILGEDPRVNVQDVKQFIRSHARDLAAKGFTHVPYENVVEGVGDLSYVMLIDRPKGSAAVLKGKFGKNDPKERTNPDIMKEDGGVISLKDKAVNMNRGPQGIEPYVQYMEPGGVVQSIKDYVGSFFEEEPIVPERNIFEEQRKVAEKEKFRPTVEEGIARAKEGRETDERLARYDEDGPLMRMIAARIRKKGEQPFTPFEKNLGLQDDPYAKKPPVPSTYQTGVEFGDIETGFDLLGQLDFNKVLLAGLRDSRTLSDFVKTPRRSDETTSRALGLSQAYYQGTDNIIQMNPLIFEDDFNATLTHELMHKGADLLQKASGQDLEKLRKNVMAKGRMSKAEHRYIQSIVNKAYVDRMLINASDYSAPQLAYYEAKVKENPDDKNYKEEVKYYKKKLQGDRNESLISEAKRVFDLYMTKENRQKFINIASPVLEANKISSYFLSKDYDYDKISDIFDIMPFRHSMAIFDISNAIMAEDHITQKFAETMQKAKSSRLSKDYDSYFPEQIPPNFDLYTPKAKAEGGVIGLKDRAVKMHRNVV